MPVCNERSTNSDLSLHAISVPPSDTLTASSPHSTKSVITKPQNVMTLRDIMCSGYVAGGNTKWFGNEDKRTTPSAQNQIGSEAIQEAINNRLAFTDDVNADYGSMLSFACPYSEVQTGARDQVISISERLLPWEVRTTSGAQKQKEGFPGGQAGFDNYKAPYGLNTIHFGEDIRAAENMEFIANVCILCTTTNIPILNMTFVVYVAIHRDPSTTPCASLAPTGNTRRFLQAFTSSSPARATLAPTRSRET